MSSTEHSTPQRVQDLFCKLMLSIEDYLMYGPLYMGHLKRQRMAVRRRRKRRARYNRGWTGVRPRKRCGR